jgi:hypothetical protein
VLSQKHHAVFVDLSRSLEEHLSSCLYLVCWRICSCHLSEVVTTRNNSLALVPMHRSWDQKEGTSETWCAAAVHNNNNNIH